MAALALVVSGGLLLMATRGVAGEATAAAEDDAEAKQKWESSATAGFTLTKGNSETLMIALAAAAERKWGRNELELKAGLNYGEERDNVTVSTILGSAKYNRLFGKRVYASGLLSAGHDDLASLAYRVTLSPAGGYYFVKNKKITLSGEAGPGLIFEKLGGVRSDYWTVRLGEKFTWQINDRVKLWQSVNYSPKIDDFGDFFVFFDFGFQTDITKRLALTLQFVDTYRSRPASGRKENDLRFISGITYKF